MIQLSDVINDFYKMLQTYPDDQKYALRFYSFFKATRFVNDEYIPFLEMGSILKHKKPTIFYELKRSFNRNFIIEVVTTATMDYDDAQKRIDTILSQRKK